jgi:UDP-glucose 4-epimerase
MMCMNDLIEHVFDPLSFLKQCRNALRPSGFISIATPNGEGFDFKILKDKTGNIAPPEHLTYFNPRSLEMVLKKAEFEIVVLETPGQLDVEIMLKEKLKGYPLAEKNAYIDFLLGQAFEPYACDRKKNEVKQGELMKVVVFGGSGFLGSHVADALTEAGHKVTIYDVKPSHYLQRGQKMVVGDILDQKKVESAVKGAGAVYNFAGIADIEQSSRDPLMTVQQNILGNTILLESSRKAGVGRFVFASTLYVYSRSGAFYRSTKQACELLIENYQEVYGLPYTVLRYGSLYGPRADEHNFVNRVLKQALGKGVITRDGDGDEIREYIHVLDAARSSVDILAKEFANQHAVISGEQPIKVRDLLSMIKEMFQDKITIKYLPPKNKFHYEVTPYAFSPRLAKRVVARTYVDLGQGILNCIEQIHSELRK